MTQQPPRTEPEDGPEPSAAVEGRPDEDHRRKALRDDLVMALRFFSRLPTGNSPHEKPDLGRIAIALPIAAVIMGAIPMLVLFGGIHAGLPPFFATALAVAAMVLVGGGMMEDALADAADGLFGGSTRERRLEILKDSRHGTYGVAALCLFLLLRVTALGSVAALDPTPAIAMWLAANIAGRSAGLWVAVSLPPARAGGASATVGALPKPRFVAGAALGLVLVFLIAAPVFGPFAVALAILATALSVLAWAALCRKLVGGQTGDLIGAAAGLCEIAALSILLIFA